MLSNATHLGLTIKVSVIVEATKRQAKTKKWWGIRISKSNLLNLGGKDMATAAFREFLESSTIHGLVHISTAKSRAARVAWVVIVVASFAFAISMITNAYLEWHQSPVSTTITTHPITELQFPTVTVCPPRGSNTAVNHLLKKVKHVNFTEEERQHLLRISKKGVS